MDFWSKSEWVRIIKNKTILIVWEPWSWKSFFASYIAYSYFLNWANIFSNIDFFYKHKNNQINKKIWNTNDLKYIDFQEKKWLIIIDEAGINANSRRSSSNKNLEFNELTFLGRKKNCDIIYIAQLDFSVDKYIRALASYTIKMNSYFIRKDYLLYEYEITVNEYVGGYKEVDLILFQRETEFFYSSLESSKIEWEKEVKNRKKQEKENNVLLKK